MSEEEIQFNKLHDIFKNNASNKKTITVIECAVNVNIKMLKSSNMKMHKYLIVNVELLSSSFLLN